jgi:hypothetical protein
MSLALTRAPSSVFKDKILQGRVKRQVNSKGRTFAGRRLYFDTTPMSTNDPADRGKAEPGAGGPGGKEWIEDPGQILFADSTTVISYLNYSFDPLLVLIPITLRSSNANLHLAIAVRRLNRVDNQVKDGIFNLSRIY